MKAGIEAALSLRLFNTSVGIFLSPKEISDSLIVKSYTVPEPLIFFRCRAKGSKRYVFVFNLNDYCDTSIVNVQDIVPIFNISQDTTLHIFVSLLTSMTHCKESERS